jgi:hypothetical protein
MTIASQHAKATHVSERLGWLIDHSMLSCRHLCVSVIKAIHWVFSASDHHHYGIRKGRKLKSMFLLEYQWVQCVCVDENDGHISLEWGLKWINEITSSFLTCMFIRKDKHLVLSFLPFPLLPSIFESYLKYGRKPISVGHRVIRALNKTSRNICAYTFFLLPPSNHPSNLFRLRLRLHMHTHIYIHA